LYYYLFLANPSDPYLYIAIGADCNICEVDGLFGTIVKVDLTSPTSQYEVVAHGYLFIYLFIYFSFLFFSKFHFNRCQKLSWI